LDSSEKSFLIEKCRQIRYDLLDCVGTLGVGHLGGSLSVVEALVVIFYRHMRIDPQTPGKEGRDRFVLSKAHAGPTLYAILADKGFFERDQLYTLNKPDSILPSHADMNLTPGVDMTAGSLGQGLSCAAGIAIGSRLKKDGARIYVIIGDGESHEGQIWEAAMFAAHQKLDKITALCDYNGMCVDGEIKDILDIEPLADKWRAFGWNVLECDGHDASAIDDAITRAKTVKGMPSMIIMRTHKGKGVSFIEANWRNNHNVVITPEQHKQALAELEKKQ
jgi:transketolase